jgi:tryptophan-rich sensory protein
MASIEHAAANDTWIERPRWSTLAASLGLVAVVAAVGSAFTDTAPGSWYDQLERPSFTPPGWAFGVAWTTLYGLMAVAAWRVHSAPPTVERREALVAYGTQLVANLGWTLVFFGMEAPWAGFAVIAGLLVAIAVTIVRFAAVDLTASALLWPYAAWVSFAAVLNLTIASMN